MKSGCESTSKIEERRIELPVLANPPSNGEKAARKDSKVSKWRAAALIALNVLMAAHIIQWWLMGRTVSPIEPSESMYTLQNGAINAGFIFFSLAILATLILGRFVCGWGCHILALQDLCAWLLNKIGLKPRAFRSRLLVFVPLIVALYMFVWPVFYRWVVKPPSQPLFPNFANHLMTTEFWATFPPIWVAIPFLFVCGFMTVYFLGSKGFCTYACPYGGFFGVADKVAPGRIRVTDACNNCGHCTAVCTSNVIVHAEVKEYGMVVDPGCMKCMDCVSVCPNDALYFGFGKPAVAVKKTVARNYSLTWPEEFAAAIIFFLSFLAVWDVYQLVPMLMALGIACVSTFLALRLYRLIFARDLFFYRYNLRSSGKIKPAGIVFGVLALAWLGLNIHSGWVRYHERAGAIAFEKVRVPDELALARTDVKPWLAQADLRNIEEGRRHFHDAVDLGIFTNKEALSKYAWLEYLAGDTERSVQLLTRAAEVQTGQGRALSLYYRGAILNRLGRYDQALSSLNDALNERPDLVLAVEEKGESLWHLGQKSEAVAAWKEALRQNPRLPLANNMLAYALRQTGYEADAAGFEKLADQNTPADPLFHWMVGLRLENAGMTELAEKHFRTAGEMNPRFKQMRVSKTN